MDQTRPNDPSRLRRLTAAALNADATIARIDDVSGGIAASLDEFNRVLASFDSRLGDFETVVDRLGGSIDRVDATLVGVEKIVGTVEWLFAPVTAVRELVQRPEVSALADQAIAAGNALALSIVTRVTSLVRIEQTSEDDRGS
ncbi:hypothetical protein M1M07_11545 [Rhodococcus sp. HM1]|uniref:hypothetical protein n=1 Tax=Rhodococcus sp. HM1 TaxID=2937759 RepID=UPI00200B9903|nr:hypothetical protein [Rhodococcus sp. HM1]MCK8671748.1 hypothetical protein [Rhodococcus sp. HM1]